jgi:hypothetical protein
MGFRAQFDAQTSHFALTLHTHTVLWLRQESNLDLKFRKLLFYPLNYGAVLQR